MLSLRASFIRFLLKNFVSKQNKDVSLQEERKFLDDLGKKGKLPRGIEVERIAIEGLKTELLTHQAFKKDKIILYFHGGAYNLGSCDSHRSLAAKIAIASQMPVLLPEYHLAPEFPFPAALNDALLVYKSTLKTIASSKIALVGDSAGGGLALATVLALRNQNMELPAALVCMSPWVDLAHSGESITTKANRDFVLTLNNLTKHALRYKGSYDLHDPLISPLYADLKGIPPMLIQVGSDEILLNDSTRLADKARRCNVDVHLEIWDQMWHVWQYFAPYMPESTKAIDQIASFLKSQICKI